MNRPASSGRGGRPPRQHANRAPQRKGPARKPLDPARRAAFDVLRAVSERDAYANLTLPVLLRERGITGLDAAFATELAYGTCRTRGLLDAVISSAARTGSLSRRTLTVRVTRPERSPRTRFFTTPEIRFELGTITAERSKV